MGNYEKLTSDKVNYLIWRYLQEAGFNQTAVRLQLDWGLQHHPEDLVFAKYIGPRCMIKLLQNGLKLHRIQNSNKPDAQLVFGPDPASTVPGDGANNTTTAATTSVSTTIRTKSSSPSRRFDTSATQSSIPAPNTSSSKPRNNRRGNGATTTTPSAVTATNGRPRGTVITGESMNVDQPTATIDTNHENDMEIDEDDSNKKPTEDLNSSVSSPTRNGELQQISTNGLENHAQIQESQQAIPAPLPVPTLTNGSSIGIQLGKVIELAPMTTVLNPSSTRNNSINFAGWNPSKTAPSSSLAVGGKQFGQIWEITKVDSKSGDTDEATAMSATTSQISASNLKIHRVTDLEMEHGHTLVSLAWSPEDGRLAYSTCFYQESRRSTPPPQDMNKSFIRIKLRSSDGVSETFNTTGDTVTNLAWNETGRLIAGLSGTSIIILDTKTGTQMRPFDVEHRLFDLKWLDKATLVVCGDSYIAVASVTGSDININHVFGSDIAGSTAWTTLRYDSELNGITVSSDDTGSLAIIQSTGKAYREECPHSASILDLMFGPVLESAADRPRILASSASNGSVRIWDSKTGKPVGLGLAMGGVSRASRLAFSPNGKILAVADWDRILFWDLEQGSPHPKYKWESRRVDWQSLTNGHMPNGVSHHDRDVGMDDLDDGMPVLTWNGPEGSLFFAHQDKVALIDVP